jgi:non-heme chloroperoxidase
MNARAPSRELWDSILLGLRANRSAFVKASIPGIFGAQDGGPGVVLEPAVLEQYENIISQADGLAMERCVQIITDKDFTQDLRRLAEEARDKVKVLILHGDSDHGMPYEASSKIVADILGHKADSRIYEKAAHGLYLTHQERVLKDILGFVVTIQ